MGKIKVRRFKMSSKKPNKWTVTDDGPAEKVSGRDAEGSENDNKEEKANIEVGKYVLAMNDAGPEPPAAVSAVINTGKTCVLKIEPPPCAYSSYNLVSQTDGISTTVSIDTSTYESATIPGNKYNVEVFSVRADVASKKSTKLTFLAPPLPPQTIAVKEIGTKILLEIYPPAEGAWSKFRIFVKSKSCLRQAAFNQSMVSFTNTDPNEMYEVRVYSISDKVHSVAFTGLLFKAEPFTAAGEAGGLTGDVFEIKDATSIISEQKGIALDALDPNGAEMFGEPSFVRKPRSNAVQDMGEKPIGVAKPAEDLVTKAAKEYIQNGNISYRALAAKYSLSHERIRLRVKLIEKQ